MAKYIVEVHAYQEVEVEAENNQDAINIAIEEGIDLGCSEWTVGAMFKKEDGYDKWEEVR